MKIKNSIATLDYGSGNLKSVMNIFEYLGLIWVFGVFGDLAYIVQCLSICCSHDIAHN